MVVATRATALCASDLRLRNVARQVVNNGCSLLKWQHMEEWHPLKVGVIGMPGSGKSGALAMIALIEDLLDEKPVWANMKIHAPIAISDGMAAEFGVERGGGVEFAAYQMDIKKLLRFDPEYRHGAIVLDEINVKLAEARRSQSNVNRWFNELDQQARKLHLCIYYSVIHEMWVDNRLRDMTDLFIKCEDPAFTVKGIRDKKRPGVDSNWYIYDMHGYRTGIPYATSHKVFGPVPFHIKDWWGIWDTEEYQSTGAGKYSVNMDDSDEEEAKQDLSWLDQALTDIMGEYQDRGETKILASDLMKRLEVPREMTKLIKDEIKERLRYLGYKGGVDYFAVPAQSLPHPESVGTYEEWSAQKPTRVLSN
jgi:hypothetical protein